MPQDSQASAENPPLSLLDSWLEVDETNNETSPPYCHLLIRQKDTVNTEVWDELYTYIDHAHEGARLALRAPLGDSLHPLQHGTHDDPAFGYPQEFCDTALQGFFGEILAGIIAENYAGGDEYEWDIPVFLFRTHVIAFQQLEVMKQTGNWERQIVGRTGDDGLAFARVDDGSIIAWLACEAKCTTNHSSGLIADNHEKLSQSVTRPVDLLRVIDALKDYRDDDYSRKWVEALRKYFWEHTQDPSVERCDLSMYVCGRLPQRNVTWIPTNTPHDRYTAERNLTSAEFQLPNVRDVIHTLYDRMDGSE